MPHKTGKGGYKSTAKHPKPGMHKMPSGRMMSNASMKKKMGKSKK